ncbi:hypothetical protein AAFF_G00425700 [Aldrovandia affinis]|uniref:Sosondowah ankyrin repeat domain family member B n=1 Tax=Aldrovandia affinis TaxID=143900 RepID=A0AAD7X0B6_9TELE|nr:hypothetical protein AAFF_G00425700 [Aldrovandia affinis]
MVILCSNEWLQRSNEAINLRGTETPIAVRLCHSLPPENHKIRSPAIHHPASLSASYGNLPLPPYEDNDKPQGSPREDKVNDNLVKFKRLSDGQGSKVHEMLNRAEETKQLAGLLSMERKLAAWHNSSSCLSYQDTRAADTALANRTSASLHSGGQRMSSKLRNRMCQSLGENLDKPFLEDGISSSHNRLSLLSSSLSMNPSESSPPLRKQRNRASAPPDVSMGKIPLAKDKSHFHRVSLAPLDPKEHDWLVKAAAGTWTNIYSLFREEPSLLTKRDFISGYTVLHWIAKHGDHRVLNTLWYGVDKAGMTIDVDIKTTCGYTPLHLAAIHGHKKLIRLLVHKYKANVAMRDSSGKKPWQYLGKSGPRDLLQLLGAPQWKNIGGTKRQSASEKLSVQPATVKRETSMAAFLKHKSLLKVTAHIESLVQVRGDGV